MQHAARTKVLTILALLLLPTCGQKEKNKSKDATHCPEGAPLVGDACTTGVQSGAQPNVNTSDGAPDPIIPIPDEMTDPDIPDVPTKTPSPIPTPSPTPTPTPEPGDDSGSDDSDDTGTDDSGNEDGTDSDDGDLPLEPLHYNVVAPVHAAAVYSDIELEARTLTLNHDADAVFCSVDAGATFGDCVNKTTHVFPVEAYRNNTTQIIRFVRTDGVRSFSEDYTYFPHPEDLPLVTFIECDHAIKAGESLETLTKLFASAADKHDVCWSSECGFC